MAVTELSSTKGMLYVSHDKETSLWSSAAENALEYRVGIGLNFSRRHIPCHTNKFLLSLAKIEANMDLDQYRIKPLNTV